MKDNELAVVEKQEIQTANTLKPGIYDISDTEYQSDPCSAPSLSASIAKILCAETPLHAWTAHPRLNPNFERTEKEIFDLGTVAHALMLQGLHVAITLDFPDWRTKDAKAMRDAARAKGSIPILQKHWDRVKAMVLAGQRQLELHKEGRNAFSNGKPEQTLVWEDDHGIICRSRVDWLSDDRRHFADYKSTGMTADPEALSRSMFGAGWDIQEAFYRRGLRKLGYDATGLFVPQEDSPPYALSVIGFGPDVQCIGDKKVQFAIDLWAKCLKENNWPGYSDRICYPTLPPWIEESWLRKESE